MAMLDALFPLLYIRLTSRSLTGLNVKSGKALEEPPLLAIRRSSDGKVEIVAMGHATGQLEGQPQVCLVNGFEHPRSLLSDFPVAEQTLRMFVRQLAPKTVYSAAPVLVLHPQEHLEGGLTMIETRGLHELCRSAGARKVHLWVGRELTREELLARQFPTEGGTLLAI
ncbi:rod shape-determining protein [Metapseudomonas otitidis]|uniref:rod shape-determining protein n=1 Tax=Metapseudomonas otitidis TaxID=319939 RepID=UPI0013F62336|nr:rod shape-determining protein [Pseudomonas otitidis]